MRRLQMQTTNSITFEQGCNKYLDNCRQRNLRQGTINHYKQSYTQFYKFFEPETPIEQITEKSYNSYVLHLRKTLHNDVSINSYLRDFITTMHFLMNEGYISPFKMQSIKVDKNHVETYTDDELKILLSKPNIKKCSFTEYQCWVMTNFLFCTGVRQRSLMFIKVKDIDFDNTGNATYREDTGIYGNKIASFLGCFHSNTKNPVQLMKVDPEKDEVYIRTYCPSDNSYLTEYDCTVSNMGFIKP